MFREFWEFQLKEYLLYLSLWQGPLPGSMELSCACPHNFVITTTVRQPLMPSVAHGNVLPQKCVAMETKERGYYHFDTIQRFGVEVGDSEF